MAGSRKFSLNMRELPTLQLYNERLGQDIFIPSKPNSNIWEDGLEELASAVEIKKQGIFEKQEAKFFHFTKIHVSLVASNQKLITSSVHNYTINIADLPEKTFTEVDVKKTRATTLSLSVFFHHFL